MEIWRSKVRVSTAENASVQFIKRYVFRNGEIIIPSVVSLNAVETDEGVGQMLAD